MPGIDRTTIITGPALITFAGQSFWSKGDVILKPVNKRFAIDTASFGKVDERFSDRRLEISFEPSGRFTEALALVLWPYGSTSIGASLYGATDRPLVIWGRDGVKVTVHNASLTQMPSVRIGVDKTIVGPIKFTGLLAKSTDPTNAAAYYTIASAAYPGDTGFDVADILTESPLANWGLAAPWVDFRSESGWEISFNLKLAEQAVDGLGTVDITLQGIDVSAKATPVGPTVAQVMTALQTAQAFGTSLSGDQLSITTATGPSVILNSAALVDADFGFGATRKRIGPCEWIACRTFTSGTPNPLFTVALT